MNVDSTLHISTVLCTFLQYFSHFYSIFTFMQYVTHFSSTLHICTAFFRFIFVDLSEIPYVIFHVKLLSKSEFRENRCGEIRI